MEFIKDKVGFTVIFWRKNVEIEYVRKFDFNSLTDQEKKIILYLEEYQAINRKQVDDILKTNARTSQRIIKQLIEKNIINSTGSTNNLIYHLK